MPFNIFSCFLAKFCEGTKLGVYSDHFNEEAGGIAEIPVMKNHTLEVIGITGKKGIGLS